MYTPYKTPTRSKDPIFKVPALTPYYVHALQDHRKKKRPHHALLRTCPTRPPEEQMTPASRYIRSRPTTYMPYKTTRRRKDLSLKAPTLTTYCVHALHDHQTKKRFPPQGTYAHALLRTRPTRPPQEAKIPSSRGLRSRPTTYTPYKTTGRRKDPILKVPTLTPYFVHALQDHQKNKRHQP
jgi:hypothetical protein